uniref:non-specific serine/threonine protein kinase n=1 Tax=Aegilops tauschii subsp. strangulata TaxID=200361 RepID=A0A453Q840_AEGTS
QIPMEVTVLLNHQQGKKVSAGAIAGSVVAGVVAPVLGVLLFLFYRRRKAKQNALRLASTILMQKVTSSATQADVASLAAGITVDKSVEFTYQELFNATEGFNITHKIGQGGFGAVYYAELVGEKAAIKKMDMQATQEFLAELKVLTHVHHLNLVRLIGYCTESSLFLVYEFVENGNLSQHLRGTDYEPLSWAERVRIALDSARGLEYIHEHTVPVYIHRDIKSANILIDKNTRAKVADFGLTKLTEVGGASLQTRVVGTFGYMPPEYVRYGDISRKVDVYAFGVVLYELISGKDAIVRPTDGSASGSRGLVYLFEEALTALDPKEGLQKLIDPKLGDDYPVDAILMMTHLANACTEEDPKLRPTMRSVVVALMTLSSMSEFWDMKNPGLVNLMSGR